MDETPSDADAADERFGGKADASLALAARLQAQDDAAEERARRAQDAAAAEAASLALAVRLQREKDVLVAKRARRLKRRSGAKRRSWQRRRGWMRKRGRKGR